MAAYKTAYSIIAGGEKGYINIGGWNSTITDVQTTPAEVCGITRMEGANKYMYCFVNVATNKGAFLSLSTAIADGSTAGGIAPICLTAPVVAAMSLPAGAQLWGMLAATTPASAMYAWVFRKGITTALKGAGSAATFPDLLAPSTTTINVFKTSTAGSFVIGYILEEAAATTATTSGVIAYLNFENAMFS